MSRPSYASRSSPTFQSRHTYSHSEEIHKYNSATDDIRNSTCWRCGYKEQASFMCNLPPPQPGSSIAPLRNLPRFSQDSNNQRNTLFSHFRNITNGSNSSPRGATGSNSADSCRSNNRISTTRPVVTRENESPTITCIKTNTNKRALIPAIINKNTEIQAFCDPCSDMIWDYDYDLTRLKTYIDMQSVSQPLVKWLKACRNYELIQSDFADNARNEHVLVKNTPRIFNKKYYLLPRKNTKIYFIMEKNTDRFQLFGVFFE
ncbi:hypothetical protein AVEN_126147-1 [Araneus ventricosus]|uniref:Uncharacterized protein n=1 Tax=Araneus ventricosus TaxID=182803 RepID=A0A4Y2KBZ0_ARAVE|nr:hypothetical protein AVEN_126147-1 [Araneus ventricosus]